jgi:Glycosyl transferase 4-like domain/Glycosyl transferases group 1
MRHNPVIAPTRRDTVSQTDRNSMCEAPDRWRWAIVSGTYAGAGGVGDYTRQIATGLAAAGDEVTVCAPLDHCGQFNDYNVTLAGIRRQFGVLSLRNLDQALTSVRPDRVLIQYVPQGFGWQGMNLPFCIWLFARRRRYRVSVMFHEVAVVMMRGKSVRYNAFAMVTHLMAMLMARSAEQIFVSIPAWERWLRPMLTAPQPMMWLPVPSNIPVIGSPRDCSRIRMSYASAGEILIGHFACYGPAVAEPLTAALQRILEGAPDRRVLLTGDKNETFQKRFSSIHPDLASRVYAAGRLSDADLSYHLGACDLMIQPYPDGISTRRGSAMACLAHGIPVVTTIGHLTEPLWKESGAVLLSPAGDLEVLAQRTQWLINETSERGRLGAAGKALYEDRFALSNTIAGLRQPAEVGCVPS